MTVAPIDATGAGPATTQGEGVKLPAPVAITLVQQLEDVVNALDLALPMFLDETGDDPTAALGVFGALVAWIGRLRNLSSLVEVEAARRMERYGSHARIEGPGFSAERLPGKERKNWRREDVLAQVIHRWLAKKMDPDGAIPREVSETAWELRDVILQVFRPEPRATALRQLGIDPDEYADVAPGTPRVLINFSQEAADAE